MFQWTLSVHMHIWANQSAIDRPGGQSGGSMYMVQRMATTLIAGRARYVGVMGGANQILHISERGQSTYVFTYTRTYRLVPVLYWFAHLHMCAHMYVCK